ncbi:DUF3459 domain-containing protein [Microbacterium dauci]|uniref:DUF3459 domain-containing protein n=1 Tax=Microbacterium dauci TaxID=3048008 RepID=A0ABT6ZEN7_9MICO|nr:DUF3459 domain-containing protein [Microbacterium sp. LX3-4]MDJ1114626.1 DUF3459 domain-containing protein [Microbacterium sp. LX3-4]
MSELDDRIEAHIPALREALAGQDEVVDVLVDAATHAWLTRSLDLRVHGEQRAQARDRLTSRFTLGGACFAGRYAGNLAGLRDEIPYLRDLGVTLLRVESPFETGADGTPDLRRIDRGLGSLQRMVELTDALRLAGISLALPVAASGDVVAFVRDVLFLVDHGVEAFVVDDTATAAVLAAVLAISAPGVVVLPGSPGAAPLWQSFLTGHAAPLRRAIRWRDGSSRVVAVRDAEAVDGLGCGTTASLAGVDTDDPHGEARAVLAHALALSVPGIPMLWLGDEVGQLDDPSYRDDPDRRGDERWLHRGQNPRDRYATRADATTSAGRMFSAITKLIAVRHTTPEFDGTRLVGFDVPGDTIAAFQRPDDDTVVLVLANVGAEAASVDATTLSGFEPAAWDLIEGVEVDMTDGVTLAPCGFRWLRVTPRG